MAEWLGASWTPEFLWCLGWGSTPVLGTIIEWVTHNIFWNTVCIWETLSVSQLDVIYLVGKNIWTISTKIKFGTFSKIPELTWQIWLVSCYIVKCDGCHMCDRKCSLFPEHLISSSLHYIYISEFVSLRTILCLRINGCFVWNFFYFLQLRNWESQSHH